jgi:uncharacterized protein (UPF0332 family)
MAAVNSGSILGVPREYILRQVSTARDVPAIRVAISCTRTTRMVRNGEVRLVMNGNREASAYLDKVLESLAGAQSEFDSGRFNNSANRAYYAAFQAAIAALLMESIRSDGEQWPHTFVQSEFSGRLVGRRHRYPSSLQDTLAELETLRLRADYRSAKISEPVARRGLRRCREFVDAIHARGAERR